MKIAVSTLTLLALGASAAAQAPLRDVCDLDVLFIQRMPRYPGYQPRYDLPGKVGLPVVAPAEQSRQHWPREGEVVTYSASVANKGGRAAPPFEYVWFLDGQEVARGKSEGGIAPGERTEIAWKWPWKRARHELELWVDPMRRVRQFSFANDRRAVWTHAKLLVCTVDRVTYESFGGHRNFLGTYSFEDWCQAHADWMNRLFARSRYPGTAPGGILERVAVDRIEVLADESAQRERWKGSAPLAQGWDGGWWFGRNADCSGWAARMDWGLIHEWGHQLGLTDLYQLDVAPENNLIHDSRGLPLLIGHRSIFAGTMMHGHGPVLFSEDQAVALNHQLWRRRGYYGDYYYQLAARNILRVSDAAGEPVAGAHLEIWQRGDDHFLEGRPVMAGVSDGRGCFELPNRPAPELATCGPAGGGYALHPNPFGQIHIVGSNGVLFLAIEARGQREHCFLELPQFNLARARQGAERATIEVATALPPRGAPPAPPAPRAVVSQRRVTLRLEGAAGWFALRADPPEYRWREIGRAAGADLADEVPGSGLYRYAAALERGGRRSARSPATGVAVLVEPWGLALDPAGLCYLRDRANGRTLLVSPEAGAIGFAGSVHWHLEGSWDHATDAAGRLYVAKWPDGYDPKRTWIRRVDLHRKAREHDRRDLAGGPFDSAAAGRFREPMGIWVEPESGRIVVADSGNDRVQILAPDGAVAAVVPDLKRPFKALLAGGRLVVCEKGAGRVSIFAQRGPRWRRVADLDVFREPIYACRGRAGMVWIADRGLGRILAIDAGRAVVSGPVFPPAGAPPLEELRGIAWDARRAELLYVDGAAKRLVRRALRD